MATRLIEVLVQITHRLGFTDDKLYPLLLRIIHHATLTLIIADINAASVPLRPRVPLAEFRNFIIVALEVGWKSFYNILEAIRVD